MGALVLGLGAGWHEPEYRAFGFPFDHRADRFEASLTIISRLLKLGYVDFEGRKHAAWARVTNLVHPEVLATQGCGGGWVTGSMRDEVNFNSLLTVDEECPGGSCSITSCTPGTTVKENSPRESVIVLRRPSIWTTTLAIPDSRTS